MRAKSVEVASQAITRGTTNVQTANRRIWTVENCFCTLSLAFAREIAAKASTANPAQNQAGSGVQSSASQRGCNFARERSEEHTSELQSHSDLVCRLLLE